MTSSVWGKPHPGDPSIPTGLPEHTWTTWTRIRLPTEVDADHHSAGEQRWIKIQEGCCSNNLFANTICLESGKHKFPHFYLTTLNGWPEAEGFKETKHHLPFLKLFSHTEKKSRLDLIELGRKGVPECCLLVETEDVGFGLCSWDCLTFWSHICYYTMIKQIVYTALLGWLPGWRVAELT